MGVLLKMIISLNNEPCEITASMLLSELLEKKGYTNACYAVTVNRCFVPRSEHSVTTLVEKDCVEIITPMQGG
jgi:thiamine biosynthesis protein ThiS